MRWEVEGDAVHLMDGETEIGYARKNAIAGDFAAFILDGGPQYIGRGECMGMAMNHVKAALGISGRVQCVSR